MLNVTLCSSKKRKVKRLLNPAFQFLKQKKNKNSGTLYAWMENSNMQAAFCDIYI